MTIPNSVPRSFPFQVLLWIFCLCVGIPDGNAAPKPNGMKNRDWWSLKPVVRPTLPQGAEANPIDRFINEELRNGGLKAVGAADKFTLLLRVELLLIGIPPSLAEEEEVHS